MKPRRLRSSSGGAAPESSRSSSSPPAAADAACSCDQAGVAAVGDWARSASTCSKPAPEKRLPWPARRLPARQLLEDVSGPIERLAIEHARELRQPLMESYVDGRTGKTHQRRARGLGNGTINLAINATQAVLKDAHKRHVIARPPDLSDETLKGSRPRRSYLQIVEIAAVFAAADAVEADARGLDWEKLRYIRSSTASAVALARELHVSDTLIRDVQPPRQVERLAGEGPTATTSRAVHRSRPCR
jgi:hypothetical protein